MNFGDGCAGYAAADEDVRTPFIETMLLFFGDLILLTSAATPDKNGLAIKLDVGKGVVGEGVVGLLHFARLMNLDRGTMVIGFRLRGLGSSSLGRISRLVGMFGAFIAGQRTDHHVDATTNQLGLEIRMSIGINFAQEFIDYLETNFRVGHFAASELEGDLDLHVLAQKVNGMLDFYAQVMRINLGA